MRTKNDNINYFYDQEADILYLSKSKPGKKDISDEVDDGVIARFDNNTNEVKGLTILDFATRTRKTSRTIKLPFQIAFGL